MTTFEVNDQCPACNSPSGLHTDAEPDDAFNCSVCGIRLNVCMKVWERPIHVWVETESSIRAELERQRASQ